eukprot:5243503-Prymnesium_polylepis.2
MREEVVPLGAEAEEVRMEVLTEVAGMAEALPAVQTEAEMREVVWVVGEMVASVAGQVAVTEVQSCERDMTHPHKPPAVGMADSWLKNS